MKHTFRRSTLWLACWLVGMMAGLAQAQQIYRIVGPDGKVTFTDRAPDPAAQAQVLTGGSNLPAGRSNTAGLPFDLQQIALRYPVVLYTANNCEVCSQARRLLVSRGIPFAEKTVNTQTDIDAFLKLSEDSPMPFMTIGSQKLKGYNDAQWSQYLTAAAYPERSQLPSGYKYPAAAPLTEPPKEAPPPAPEAASPPPQPAAPAPSGIRF